ncbi:MAG TPA: hypothetical protein DD000_11680, partial [Cyanobacteria bacterium UBA11166]|nr:hypothetical protein [Cyanobacteria bacterium UBA11166]
RGSRGAGELGTRFDDFLPNLKISGLNAQQLIKLDLRDVVTQRVKTTSLHFISVNRVPIRN